MKKAIRVVAVLIAAAVICMTVAKEAKAELGGQVFYKYGQANFSGDRSREIFTDTLGAGGTMYENDGASGMSIGAGLDLPLIANVGPGMLLGEVFVEYSEFSREKVANAAPALLGAVQIDTITVSELAVVIAPKYRVDLAGGKVRAWVIPVGLAFLVNSPPSNDVTYLGIGNHMGVGIEYKLFPQISIGVDYRYTMGSGNANTETTYSSMNGYVGINF